MTYRRTKHSVTDKIFGYFIATVLVAMVLLWTQGFTIPFIGMITNDNTFRSDYARFTVKAWLPMTMWWQPPKLNFAQSGNKNDVKSWVKFHDCTYDRTKYTMPERWCKLRQK